MKNSFKKTIAGIVAAATMVSSSGMLCVTVSASPVSAAASWYQSNTAETGLNTTNMTLTKGYKFTLKFNGSTSGVTYKSANPRIATVNSKGKVVGKGVGRTVIYASKGSKVYSCTVTVVATKVLTSRSNVNIEDGSSAKITVQAKGERYITATSSDKDVATISWGRSWNKDKITLYINAVGPGTADIQLYNPKYPETIKTVKVTVPETGVIRPDVSSVSAKAGQTSSFKVYSTSSRLAAYSDDNSVASVSISKGNGYFTVTVKGNAAGTTGVNIYDRNDRSISTYVPVTIASDITTNPNARYYVEREFNLLNPASMDIEVRSETDRIVYWADEETSKLMFMLVPYNYTGLTAGEYIIPVTTMINNDQVFFDGNDYYWYMFSQDSGYYSRRRLDIAHPQNNKVLVNYGDKLVWDISSNGIIEYMVVPDYSQTDFSQYKYVLNYDGSPYFVKTNYYKVVTAYPRKKAASDTILMWNTYNGGREYMLVPANYDKVRAETIRAKFSGEYQYYTVYSSKPRKTVPSDIIVDFWNDNAEETRYILVPRNYNEYKVDDIIDKDSAETNIPYGEYNVQEVIDGINRERTNSGISKLIVDDALTAAANVRAGELDDRFSHKRPDGSSYTTALEDANAYYSSSEEIILRDMDYSSDVLEELFDDSDYRDTLLKSRNKRIGVAYNGSKDYYVIIVTD